MLYLSAILKRRVQAFLCSTEWVAQAALMSAGEFECASRTEDKIKGKWGR